MPPRNYIRILPDLYERKGLGVHGRHGQYPPAAFGAYIAVLCLAEQQPTRGVFQSEKLLRVLLEGPTDEGKAYAKQIGFLVARGDLVHGPAGSLIVDGWQELQEGNWQAAERMARYRERERERGESVTPTVTPRSVTPVTPRNVTAPPRGRAGLAVEGEGEGEGGRAVTVPSRRESNGAKPTNGTSSLDAARQAIARHESGDAPLNPVALEAMQKTIARHEATS